MKKPKKYTIDSFEKLCNVVNDQNAEVLAIDLAAWLLYYNHAISEFRKAHPEFKDKLNTELAIGSFTWVDDGKNEILGTTITNGQTGEITEKDYTNKKQKRK